MKCLLLIPLLFALNLNPDMMVWELPTKDPTETRYLSMITRDGRLYSKIFIDYGCGKPLALLMTGSYMRDNNDIMFYALSDKFDIGNGCKASSMLVASGKLSKDGKVFDAEANIYSSKDCKDKSKSKRYDDDVGGRWRRVR